MKGKIIAKTGDPKSYKYTILGEDNVKYFAHVGDLKANEDLVYEAGERRADLENGDTVEFESITFTHPRAIHIKKAQ